MCQFFWWGSPCTGQSTGGGPYLFFRSPEPLPGEPILRPLAGLYKTRNSHLAGNSMKRVLRMAGITLAALVGWLVVSGVAPDAAPAVARVLMLALLA